MTTRREIPAEERHARPPVPEFTPVPRKYRYDGWTPERQRAFIGALAETGCVSRAAGMVNMAQANCYTLRRAPGAEEFRRAWDAALDFGVKRLKDIAFERAIEGELVPVFVAGKLIGFRRKYNDKLLMFCLRHYGEDASGKRVTVNYFSTRASASAGTGGASAGDALQPRSCEGEARAGAEASATTVRTVISGRDASAAGDGAAALDRAAAVLERFEGVRLDPEAEAAIAAALEACAARARADEAAFREGGEAAADAGEEGGDAFVRLPPNGSPYRGALESGSVVEPFERFAPGEAPWMLAGADKPEALVRFEEEMAARARARSRDEA